VSRSSVRPLALFVFLATVSSPLAARAQFNGSGGPAAPPPTPPPGGYVPAMGGYGSGYGYGSPPGWAAPNTPYQGYMNGAANITTANAQYQLTIQQAKQAREEARRSALQTRRATMEERQYELSQQPTAEDLRQKDLRYNSQRSRNNPPLAEIWSGGALNDLLRVIQDGQSHGLTGPEVPLPSDLVQHINLTTGTTYGGVGLLRDDGKLTWPAVLRKSTFDKWRNKLNQLFPQAVKQAHAGPVDVNLVDEVGATLKELQEAIDALAQDLSPSQFIEASRYTRELKSGYQVLQQSDVAKYFQSTRTAQGATVGDMVKQMTKEGLRFAPATSGDEPYYTSMHRLLVDYDVGIAQLSASVARR
jgi:hypothetical protein